MTVLTNRSELEMSDADFRIIQTALRQETGIALPLGKRPLVISRLTRRLRSLKLRDFSQYTALISRQEGANELAQMISALTTNVTAFFREGHHFDMLRESVLPGLIERARNGGRVRLWSAACSSGQEPYSLAITLLGLCPEAERLNFRILATDIDPAILALAQTGTYPEESLETVPKQLRERWFKAALGGKTRSYRISSDCSRLIHFRRLNLTGPWPIKGQFDVIFCRNVAIYFDRESQEQLWCRLAKQLAPGGVLCIGHSERVAGPATSLLRAQGITTYLRLADEGDIYVPAR